MAEFCRLMNLQPGMRVIDLGGTTRLWKLVPVPLDITVLNLATQAIDEHRYGRHRFRVVRGDATNAPELASASFDLAFSNSVIEHVGPHEAQQRFAETVRRLAPSYWVQTPAKTFPIEAHTGLPFWWYYPSSVRRGLIRRWKADVPDYADFIAGTRYVPLGNIRSFFPEARIRRETFGGFVKSYVAWHRADAAAVSAIGQPAVSVREPAAA